MLSANRQLLGLTAAFLLLTGPAWAQSDILDRVGKALGDAVSGTGGSDRDQRRADDAVSLCRDHAAQLVRKAGGQSVSVERVRQVDVRGDRADVQADMRGRYDREESSA